MDTYTTLWLAIVGTAVGTWAMRVSFLGPWARGTFPAWIERGMRYAPAVIFAALITPIILKTGQNVPSAQLFARVSAAAVTLGYALRFGGQVWPLVAGMATLHGLQACLG